MKVRHLIDPEIYQAGVEIDEYPFQTIQDFIRKDAEDRKNLQGIFSKKMNCREVIITKKDGEPMRLCVFAPLGQTKEPLPGILFAHGGAFACGLPEISMSICERMMEWSPCVIVSPDYRLSIREPFPAAVEDCYEALAWMKEHSAELLIRDDQLFLAGESAGGGLAASLAIMARDRGEVNIAFQMPLYPMLDNTMSTRSMKDNDSLSWCESKNALAWSIYLGENYRSADITKYASPSRETDYSNLPPAYSLVGSCDPFVDETLAYISNLQKAGIEAKCNVYEGGFHAFENVCPESALGKRALSDFREAYCYAVKNCFSKQAK